MSLVALLPLIDSDASSMSQCAQLGLAVIRPLACARTMSACRSASMFSLSSLVSGRSMRSACTFTQCKLNAILLHHHMIRSWIVTMRSQSHFLLWKMLSVFGLLSAVNADSLSHNNRTDRIFMAPARNNVPRTASPATRPPISERYEFISDRIPSSGPPPQRRIVLSFVARTHPWYPTPNSTDPSVAMIRSTGSSKSTCSGIGSAGISPVSLIMCRGRDSNESPMPDV
jgi:hypothetical protein